MDEYKDVKQGGITTYSYSNEQADREFVLSKEKVLTIEQGKNKVVLSRTMIDELPKFAARWI